MGKTTINLQELLDKVELDHLARAEETMKVENKSLARSMYYCIPGTESNIVSMLSCDEEFVRRLWVDACKKWPEETQRRAK